MYIMKNSTLPAFQEEWWRVLLWQESLLNYKKKFFLWKWITKILCRQWMLFLIFNSYFIIDDKLFTEQIFSHTSYNSIIFSIAFKMYCSFLMSFLKQMLWNNENQMIFYLIVVPKHISILNMYQTFYITLLNIAIFIQYQKCQIILELHIEYAVLTNRLEWTYFSCLLKRKSKCTWYYSIVFKCQRHIRKKEQ